MKTCENCKYSEPVKGGLACMGQKGMPFVKPTDSCERWKTKKQTNYDRIRSMTDEELAKWFEGLAPSSGWHFFLKGNKWLDWLKQEVEE